MAVAGALACLAITTGIWVVVSRQQSIWPLPALYLIELPVLSIAGAFGVFRAGPPGAAAVWAVVGVLLAFAFLGILSVGLLFLPVVLLFAITAVLIEVRQRGNIVLHLAVCAAAGIAQAALMLTAIQFL